MQALLIEYTFYELVHFYRKIISNQKEMDF